MQRWIKIVPLVLAGSLCSIGCVATTTGPDAGDGCRSEGQEWGGSCGRPWFLCQGGKWIPIHCDPPSRTPVDARPDAAVDVRDAAEGAASVDGGGPIDAAALDENDNPRMAP